MCGAPDRRSPLTALAQPPSDTTHVSVTKPPTSALPPSGTNPVPLPPPTTLCPRLPPPPFPPSSRPGPSGPCQENLPFRFPVHRLHWSCHSLSPIVPLPSVIRPPDQCRPRTPYNICLLHSPCPHLTPLPPST